jgi:[acyl-carrier-protein] S-malonyltransferase
MSRAIVFPGQGSQYVGMGKEFFDNFSVAREVFEEVDSALEQPLSTIIFGGPSDQLKLTENTQPALMATSVAIMRVIEKESGKSLEDIATFVAGHSLGEYSALCAAGSISLADTAKLVRLRGKSMQEAVPEGIGGMAALLGLEINDVVNITEKCSSKGLCQIANDNSPGQMVISGTMSAIDYAIKIATSEGKKAVKLPVSAPFHSELMAPVAAIMEEALANVEVKSPSVPIIANIVASAVTDPTKLREYLVQQVTGQVKWRQSMLHLKSQGIGEIVEVGAGKVLVGLAKRTDRDFKNSSIQDLSSLENFLKEF